MMRLAPQFIVIAVALAIAALMPAPKRAQADTAEVARTTGVRVLGATRGYATTALWLRAGDAYRRGDYYETLAAYQLIQQLQPRNPAVYSYLSWNQAYNISAPFPEYAAREEWVIRGLRTLHDGQDRMPADASLRQEEWHFLLNRTIGYPISLLSVELRRYRDADNGWAVIVEEQLLKLSDTLTDSQRGQLEEFLREVGAHISLFRVLLLKEGERSRLLDPAFESLPPEQQGDLGAEFQPFEREQARAFFALDTPVQELLTLAHWCRLHLMTLTLRPALEMQPRNLQVEISLIISYRLAWQYFPAGGKLAEHFLAGYQEGVAVALRAGIENARRRGGEQGQIEFLAHARENLEDVPELLERRK